MRVEQEQVECFHEKMGYPVGDAYRPALPTYELSQERYNFMREELNEYSRAIENHDLTEVADALADLIYVALGTAVVCGLDMHAIFAEVHRSNMTKDVLDPVTKKGGKGPGFERPQLAAIILAQRLAGVD